MMSKFVSVLRPPLKHHQHLNCMQSTSRRKLNIYSDIQERKDGFP